MPLKPYLDPSKIYNFWVAETSFRLTPRIKDIIKKIPGVEFLCIFTDYKFRIAVGNNFSFKFVKGLVEKALGAESKAESIHPYISKELNEQILELIDKQLSKHPFWSICILPNGEIDTISSDVNSEEFSKRLSIYKKVKEMVGATVFSYENYQNN